MFERRDWDASPAYQDLWRLTRGMVGHIGRSVRPRRRNGSWDSSKVARTPPEKRETMPHMNIAMPVLPGQEDAARALAREVAGPRRGEFGAFQAQSETRRETWTLQQTPAGTFILVWFDSDDLEKGFADLATGQDDFTVWLRGQIQDVTGVDMSGPDDSPMPEPLLDWSA
jgi:hypothetical protein